MMGACGVVSRVREREAATSKKGSLPKMADSMARATTDH